MKCKCGAELPEWAEAGEIRECECGRYWNAVRFLAWRKCNRGFVWQELQSSIERNA